MKEMLGIFVAFIALLIAWRCWKKTVRAMVRDRLFDLRDELRDHYVENGLDMNDGAYAQTRERLNNLLRYTKSMRMIGYIYFSAHVDREMVEATAADFEAVIQECDCETAKLIHRIRRQSCEAILLYMASTSLGFISAVILMFICFLPSKIIDALKRCLRSVFDLKPATLECAAMC